MASAWEVAETVVDRLRSSGHRLVLAESCTCGLLAATLGAVPGVSEFFCGSAVTYRDATKHQWLGIGPSVTEEHSAVSAIVTRQMAASVLRQTAEADVSLAITGHLGPSSPDPDDGVVYVCVALRAVSSQDHHFDELRCELIRRDRVGRQQEAAARAWRFLLEFLSDSKWPMPDSGKT